MKKFSVRLVVADERPAASAGMQSMLERADTMSISGRVDNPVALIGLLDSQACDVLLADYAMQGGPYGDGLVLLELIKKRHPKLKIVAMITADNPATPSELLMSGVNCILSRSDDFSHLVPAVHVAFGGGKYFSPAIANMLQKGGAGGRGVPAPELLTVREREVVRLYVSGLTVNEVAERLHRSNKTVSTQKMSAMKKLNISNDANLFKYAMEIGLLS
jgi:two-component system capsular synthesis response regulator RcsB